MRYARHLLLPFLACAFGCTPLNRDYPVNHGRWGERVVVDAGVMPAYWLRFDQQNGGESHVDVAGPGYHARVGIGNADQSVGLLYHGTFLEEDDGAAEVDVHALFLDFDVSVPVEPDGPMFVHAAAGIGMAHLDSPDPALDTTTGAVNLRLHLEVRPWERLAFLAGVGAFAFGNAGDSEAYGTFFDLGMRVTF